MPFRLIALDGGTSANAIPREATASCSVSPVRESAFRAALDQAAVTVREACAKTDPGVDLTVGRAADAADASTERGEHGACSTRQPVRLGGPGRLGGRARRVRYGLCVATWTSRVPEIPASVGSPWRYALTKNWTL